MCERALLRVSCPARWAAACCCRHMRCGVVGQWWLCFLAASKQRLLGCGQPLGPHGAWRVVRGAGSRPHVALVLHTGVSCNCMAPSRSLLPSGCSVLFRRQSCRTLRCGHRTSDPRRTGSDYPRLWGREPAALTLSRGYSQKHWGEICERMPRFTPYIRHWRANYTDTHARAHTADTHTHIHRHTLSARRPCLGLTTQAVPRAAQRHAPRRATAPRVSLN